jgi:hypothetical protein
MSGEPDLMLKYPKSGDSAIRQFDGSGCSGCSDYFGDFL